MLSSSQIRAARLSIQSMITPSPILTLSLSPDNTLVAAGHENGTVTVWSTQTRTIVATLFGVSTQKVLCTHFFNRAQIVYAVCADTSLCEWTLSDRRLSLHSKREGATILCAIKQTQRQFLLGMPGGQLLFASYTHEYNEPLLEDPVQFDIVALADTREARTIFGGPKGQLAIRVWYDNETVGPFRAEAPIALRSLVALPDNRRIIMIGDGPSPIQIWDSHIHGLLLVSSAKVGPQHCATPICSGKFFVSVGDDNRVNIWNSRSLDLAHVYDNPSPFRIRSVCGVPGESFFLLGDDSGQLKSHQIPRRILEQDRHEGRITTMVALPNGTELVTGGQDGEVRVWDARQLSLRSTLPGSHRGQVNTIAVSSAAETDCRFAQIVSGGNDGAYRQWTMQLDGCDTTLQIGTSVGPSISAIHLFPNDTEISARHDGAMRPSSGLSAFQNSEFVGHTSGVVGFCVLPSPGGDLIRLVSAEHTGMLSVWQNHSNMQRAWDNGSWYCVRSFHIGEAVASIAEMGRSKILVGTQSGLIRMVDIDDGESADLLGHTESVFKIEVRPDFHWAISVSEDGMARLWDLRKMKNSSVLCEGRQAHAAAVLPSWDRLILANGNELRTVDCPTHVHRRNWPGQVDTTMVWRPVRERLGHR